MKDRFCFFGFVLVCLLCVKLLTGCSNGRYIGPRLTVGGTYGMPNGSSIGGSVTLDPSFARQKK